MGKSEILKEGGLMLKKSFLVFGILLIFANCAHNELEKAIDYFYPLEKGKTYVYVYGEFIRQFTIEEISMGKKGKTIVKISEKISMRGRPGIIGRNFYIYEVQDNLIKQIGGFLSKSVILKGPIKKGTKWKVKSYEFRLQEGKRITHVTKVWIDGFKEMDIFNSKRRCIVVKTYEIIGSNRSIATAIWCKGIGFVESSNPAGKMILKKVI